MEVLTQYFLPNNAIKRTSFSSRDVIFLPEVVHFILNITALNANMCIMDALHCVLIKIITKTTFFSFYLKACAHRWKNVYYESEHILPHGFCSVISPTLQGKTQTLIPCYEGKMSCDSHFSVDPHGVQCDPNDKKKLLKRI